MKPDRNKTFQLGCLAVCLVCLVLLGIRINRHTSPEFATRMVYNEIERLSDNQDNLKAKLHDPSSSDSDPADKHDGHTIVHVYTNHVLTDWNSNIVDSKNLCGQTFTDSIVELSNGIYLVSAFSDSLTDYVLLDHLFRVTSISNDYLRNEFVPARLYGEYRFELTGNRITVLPVRKASTTDSIIVLVLTLVALGLALALVNSYLGNCLKGRFAAFALMLSAAAVLFVALQFLHGRLLVFASDVFGSPLFNSGMALSLGTLFEFQVCCSALVISLMKQVGSRRLNHSQTALSILSPVMFAIAYGTVVVALRYVTGANNINLCFGDLAGLNIYSYLFFLLICLAVITSLLFCSIFVRICTGNGSNLALSVISAAALAVAAAIITGYYVGCAAGLFIWMMMALLFKGTLHRGVVIAVIVVLTSALLTCRFRIVEYAQRNAEMTELAGAVAYKHNDAFESNFTDFEKSIASDSLISEWAKGDSPTDDSIISYISTRYLAGTASSIDAIATFCKPGQELLFEPEEVVVDCAEHFGSVVANSHHEKVDRYLTLIDLPSPETYYLADFEYGSYDSSSAHLYIEFFESSLWENLNMPDILLEENDVLSRMLKKYSFAVYHDNVLVYKNGTFLYPNFRTDMEKGGFFSGRRFMHFGLDDGGYKSVVVSCERKSFLYTMAPFSYFCLMLFILSLLLLGQLPNSRSLVVHNSFRFKLQAVVLSTLFIILMAIGPISVIFIRNGYENTANEYRFQNTRSIMTNLQNDMHPDLDATDNEALLEMYSNTFSTDVNLYDTLGALKATSRHYLFDEGLVAPQMDANAYTNIHKRKRLYYFQRENIGRAAFRTAYIPLRDEAGNAFAYLSLPDYTTEAALSRKTTSFIFSYINIVLLLVGLSSIVVLLLSRRITRPLRLIQERMKEVRIDKPNQPIEWNSKDEIGQLVKQYNLTLAELERSAGMLARSERETAWRDMARQVAHEIKNPLTPMRLSIQFLQQSWRENDSKLEQRFNDTTALLIEQIDSLSAIASAFSDYAKLPHNTLEEFNLAELVQNTASLYNNNPNISFGFHFDPNNSYKTVSDRNNLGRAVGNIVKNAVQAIGDKPDGKIGITITESDGNYLILVADNGCGIEEDEKKNIFLPNFTTKSSGMGVGLSITRNIIESLKGTISFESEVGAGTTFRIQIPKEQQ